MSADKPKCARCFFWKAVGATGNCHRFPPIVVGLNHGDQWPTTYDTDWCGEWKENPWSDA